MAKNSKPNFPKKVTVLGISVAIRFSDDLIDSDGIYCHDKREIVIEESLSIEDKYRVLFHEISHCLQYRTGMYYGYDKGIMEIMAESTANVFFELFRELGMEV